MNGTVVDIQDFCTKRCCVRNRIHERCYTSIKSPSAYTADLFAFTSLHEKGESVLTAVEKRGMLSGHNASSYGFELDS